MSPMADQYVTDAGPCPNTRDGRPCIFPVHSQEQPCRFLAGYRQGRHQDRNVYRLSDMEPDGDYIGVFFDPADAALAVAALNGRPEPVHVGLGDEQLAEIRELIATADLDMPIRMEIDVDGEDGVFGRLLNGTGVEAVIYTEETALLVEAALNALPGLLEIVDAAENIRNVLEGYAIADRLQQALAEVDRLKGRVVELEECLVETGDKLSRSLGRECTALCNDVEQDRERLLFDLSEDLHADSRCGVEGPPCPGCVIDRLRAELNAANETIRKATVTAAQMEGWYWAQKVVIQAVENWAAQLDGLQREDFGDHELQLLDAYVAMDPHSGGPYQAVIEAAKALHFAYLRVSQEGTLESHEAHGAAHDAFGSAVSVLLDREAGIAAVDALGEPDTREADRG